jgi:transformation/transcription domain-associated protein
VFAEELMSTLRRTHATLWSSLESLLEELIVRFRPSYEEELLAYITALLEKAESLRDSFAHPEKKAEEEKAMVASVAKTLVRISAKFFRPSSSETGSGRKDDRAKKTAQFKRKYMQLFETDFQVSSSNDEQNSETTADKEASGDTEAKPEKSGRKSDETTDKAGNQGTASDIPLDVYLARLRKWRNLLESQVSLTPSSVPLIEASPSLATFAGKAPDLWPGSCDPRHASRTSSRFDIPQETEGNFGQSSTTSSVAAANEAAAAAARTVVNSASTEGCGGDYGGGSSVIEIPGQYAPYVTSAQDSTPFPELHAKLARFEASVQVVRRNEQLVRRLGMVGTDGSKRYFLLQFAIPYWTRTDERTAQLQFVIDKLLRRGIMSGRNHLSLQPTPVIPIAQRLRMIAEDDSRVSLDRVGEQMCGRAGVDYGALVDLFHEKAAQNAKAKKPEDLDDAERLQLERSSKLAAFRDICENHLRPDILLSYVAARLEGPEALFHFRRRFAGQLAADSLLQHAFCVVERTPSRFAFVLKQGKVLPLDYRFEYNNQGALHLI